MWGCFLSIVFPGRLEDTWRIEEFGIVQVFFGYLVEARQYFSPFSANNWKAMQPINILRFLSGLGGERGWVSLVEQRFMSPHCKEFHLSKNANQSFFIASFIKSPAKVAPRPNMAEFPNFLATLTAQSKISFSSFDLWFPLSLPERSLLPLLLLLCLRRRGLYFQSFASVICSSDNGKESRSYQGLNWTTNLRI